VFCLSPKTIHAFNVSIWEQILTHQTKENLNEGTLAMTHYTRTTDTFSVRSNIKLENINQVTY